MEADKRPADVDSINNNLFISFMQILRSAVPQTGGSTDGERRRRPPEGSTPPVITPCGMRHHISG